jgi:hypothetical protein
LSTETIIDIADRVDRAGDRYRNALDFERENQSRIAAAAIRATVDLNKAREIARAFDRASRLDRSEQTATVLMSGAPPRRPWWKWWRSSRPYDRSDESSDDS